MTVADFAPAKPVNSKVLAAASVLCASLFALGCAFFMGLASVAVALIVASTTLSLWRPRYGLFAILFALVTFEPTNNDRVSRIGRLLQSDFSTTTPISYFSFTPLEYLIAITALSAVARAVVARRGLRSIQLGGPLLVLLGLILLSIGWGVGTGGDLTASVWETRALFGGALIALLMPEMLPKREHVESLISLLCFATVLLSLDVIWRRFTVLAQAPVGGFDLAFDHVTPVIMNFVVVLLLARLIWPASRLQRLTALAIPLILYAEMLTERRAGWVGLDLGLMLLALFVFRFRRKLFYFLVLPLVLLYAGYLVTFWNAQGTIAQPARAVRSLSSPDARDASSNLYRQLEMANIHLNIQAHPITGLGFGQPYVFYLPLPDLSWWPFWRYEAHDSILWLWMEMGPLGFIAFLTLMGAGIVRGVQALRLHTRDRSAPLLVACVSLILMVVVYNWVDLGLVNLRLTAFAGLALGVIGAWSRYGTQSEETP